MPLFSSSFQLLAPTSSLKPNSSSVSPLSTSPGSAPNPVQPSHRATEEATGTGTDHESPFHEDQESEDGYFSSTASATQSRKGSEDPAGEEDEALLKTPTGHASHQLHQPSPSRSLPRASPSVARGSPLIEHYKANMDIPSSPGGAGSLRRSHTSPRHHGLSALSPLQGLSPMAKTSSLRPAHSRSISGDSDVRSTNSAGGHSRSGSVTRSLSRRASVYRSAAEWGDGKEYVDENSTQPTSLFSRLTLVKAPASEQQGLRKRSKSSSALAPIGMSQSVDIPATSARAPRRSFASSFNTFTPMSPAKPAATVPAGSPDIHRISSLHGLDQDGPAKTYTPDQVVELARGLASPVLMPEGGFKGAELKRRKSAGASYNRHSTQVSPDKQPPTALEPVEYVQLADDMLLPFVDRAEEVRDLIKHPSNEKLFTLLRATFPKDRARRNWQEIPPVQWNWDEFKLHLTELDRIECPDYAWIFRARQAVRQRSVALWEKVGVCLGCDDRLLNAGSEDGTAQTWGGLEGDGEDDIYGVGNQVWIEGISPVDPDAMAKATSDFIEEFGEVVEDDPSVQALLGAIGEGEEEEVGDNAGNRKPAPKRQTTAQRAGTRFQRDPLLSPLTASSGHAQLYGSSVESGNAIGFSPSSAPDQQHISTSKDPKSRSKSFVGLTIISGTSPNLSRRPSSGPGQSPKQSSGLHRSPSGLIVEHQPILDRGPGLNLFPSSFSTLSPEPNLGRAASGLVGGIKPVAVENQFGGREGWRGVGRRKASGTGLSESAITFASESDYAHSAEHYD